MENFVNALLLILAGLLIILVLLQSSAYDGLASALTGSKDLTLFVIHKERGAAKFLSRLTLFCGLFFFALIIVLKF